MFSNKKPIFSQCSPLHLEKTGSFLYISFYGLRWRAAIFYRSKINSRFLKKSQLVLCKDINFFLKNKISLKNLCVGGILCLIYGVLYALIPTLI